MAITKIQSESLNLADTYAFTGTVTGAGEKNLPYFEASTTGLQAISQDTITKLTFGTENQDSAGNFSSDRWTPQIAGKYFCYARATTDPSNYNNGRDSDLKFYKNGSAESSYFSNFMVGNLTTSTGSTAITHNLAGIITFNGSSDYLEVYGRLFCHSGSGAQFGKKLFGAFLVSTT